MTESNDPTQPFPPAASYYQPPQPPNPAPPRRGKRRGLVIAAVSVLVIVVGAVVGLAIQNKSTPAIAVGAITTPSVATGTIDPNYVPPAPTEPTPAAAPSDQFQDMKPGKDAVQAQNDDGYEVDAEVLSVKFTTDGCGAKAYTAPDKGYRYAVIRVGYQAPKGHGSYNPYDWSVRDTSGNTYNYGDGNGLPECKGLLDSGNGLRGILKANVMIQVPTSLAHGEVVYAPSWMDDSASWKF